MDWSLFSDAKQFSRRSFPKIHSCSIWIVCTCWIYVCVCESRIRPSVSHSSVLSWKQLQCNNNCYSFPHPFWQLNRSWRESFCLDVPVRIKYHFSFHNNANFIHHIEFVPFPNAMAVFHRFIFVDFGFSFFSCGNDNLMFFCLCFFSVDLFGISFIIDSITFNC